MGRTMAVVLFTDLVGSTELRGRLGEEAADELRRKHDQLLAQVVEANNGRVVKGLGDGIMATFGGAADAVAAAVAIQQAVDRLNRSGKASIPLAVRVGLSAGDVAVEEDDVHGTPVVEASRLCGAAVGGEILASEIVRWLGGAQGALSLTPVGSLELKGLADGVPAVRVEWDPAPASALPMPALLTDIGRIFVGRDAQLERLAQLWKEAVAGERRVVLLAGEPGVGKTRLAAELAITAHEEGAAVLAGRCDEDLGVPYQPFVEALRHFVDHTEPAKLRERLGRYGGELVRLVPELRERVPDLPSPMRSDPETERYRLFDAVAAWLSAASADEPVLFLLDDLQWAAKPTILLLRHVARPTDSRPLFILGTYRDTDLTHDHPLVDLVADLRRATGVERLSLSGLDNVAVAAMVEQAAGHALDQDGLALARAIHHETEGNPFFVREVLRHLSETNAIERRDDRWTTTAPIDKLGIPEGVRDVVGRRLARLSEGAHQALRVAAVFGTEFETALVQAAGDFPESALLSALDEAIEARLVTEVAATRFRFAHALVRATLYESLSGTRKVALHRRVAEAIENAYEDRLDNYLPALAHHWANASVPADTAKAVEYFHRAGDRALAQLAHDEAVAYYDQGLELLSLADDNDGPRRLDLLIGLGEAQRRVGDAAFRETFLVAARLAEEQGDSDGLARAALGNHRWLWSAVGRVDADRVDVLERALRAQPDRPSAIRAELLANLAVEVTYGGDERRISLSEQAVTMARELDDPATLARVLQARVSAIWGPDSVNERLETTSELLAIAEQLGDPVTLCAGLYGRWLAAVEIGDGSEADRCLRRSEPLEAELARPLLRWLPTFARASEEVMRGRFETAERLGEEGWRLARDAGQLDADILFAAFRFTALFHQGRLADIAAQILDLDMAQVVSVRALETLLYCEMERHADAATRLERLVTDLSRAPREGTWMVAAARTALSCACLGDAAGARTVHDLLLPYEHLTAVTGTNFWGAVAHHLGALAATMGRFAEAEARYRDAEATHRRLSASTWLARTRLEWARMLLTRRQPGDIERARDLLGPALDSARGLGLTKVERDAAALLQDCA